MTGLLNIWGLYQAALLPDTNPKFLHEAVIPNAAQRNEPARHLACQAGNLYFLSSPCPNSFLVGTHDDLNKPLLLNHPFFPANFQNRFQAIANVIIQTY